MPTLPLLGVVALPMLKTQVSYRRGCIKVAWLGRACMVKVKAVSLRSIPTTTTAALDDGSYLSFCTRLA
jgi:hypothetical protein